MENSVTRFPSNNNPSLSKCVMISYILSCLLQCSHLVSLSPTTNVPVSNRLNSTSISPTLRGFKHVSSHLLLLQNLDFFELSKLVKNNLISSKIKRVSHAVRNQQHLQDLKSIWQIEKDETSRLTFTRRNPRTDLHNLEIMKTSKYHHPSESVDRTNELLALDPITSPSAFTDNLIREESIGKQASAVIKSRSSSRKRRKRSHPQLDRAINNTGFKVDEKGRQILTILGLFELSYNATFKRESGESELVAAGMALADINEDLSLLPGYKLELHTNDTQCDPGTGVDAFFHALYDKGNRTKRIISVLGSVCSEVTERVAKVATYKKILQVSFGSTSPSLADQKEFPLFYRTVASVSSHSQAIIELLTYLKWDTVYFLTENKNRYTMPVNYLMKALEQNGKEVKAVTFSPSVHQSLEHQLQLLHEADARIVIASFSAEIAPQVFCEVHRLEMFGPDYAWIWIGKPESLWWKGKQGFGPKQKRPTAPTSSSSKINPFSKKNFTSHIFKLHNDSGSSTSSEEVAMSYKTMGPIQSQSRLIRSTSERHSPYTQEVKCRVRDVAEAVENTIVVDRVNMLTDRIHSQFGMTTESFVKRVQEGVRERRQEKVHHYEIKTRNTSSSPASNQSFIIEPDHGNSSELRRGDPRLSQFSPEAYDAVWTIALGLKNLLASPKCNYSIDNCNYTGGEFAYLLKEEIGRLKFIGISGPIAFSGTNRVGLASFMQIQGGELHQVGLYNPSLEDGHKLQLWSCSAANNNNSFGSSSSVPPPPPLLPCHSLQWPGNQVPVAKRKFYFKPVHVEDSLYIFVTALAFFGILMAVAFLAFNLYYRKLKYIMLSSPRLNNMVIIGCIFAYIAVIILGSDFGRGEDVVVEEETTSNSNPKAAQFNAGESEKRFSYICTIRAYLLSTAFSLAFGSMFAKTYRVHRIFTRSCIGVVKNKLLRDTQLMTLIMVLLLIDVIIVTSWAIFDPMHHQLKNLAVEMDTLNRSIVYQPQVEVCRSQHLHVWLIVMYSYKSLLLVVGIYMAWETRHVKIEALNDSKNIAYCVYIVVLTSVIAVTLANLISDRVTLSFVSIATLILISTTVTLCLLFLPKIHAIKTGGHKRDPVVESMGLKIESNTRRFMVEDGKELLFRAEVQNRVYKRQIEAIDVEIWRLENLLVGSSQSSVNSGNKSTNDRRCSVKDQGESADGESSEDASSEIYTVYLHGPRFIVPISILNFQNPQAAVGVSNSEPMTNNSLLQPPCISPPPRSSWPNVRSFFVSNSGISLIPKIRFKSEPKLVIDEASTNTSPMETETTGIEPVVVVPKLLLAPRVTFDDGESGESSRKSSVSDGKRFGLMALLKQPFNYFTGFINATTTTASGLRKGSDVAISRKSENTRQCEMSIGNEKIFTLNVPLDTNVMGRQQKFNSVPDLWAVRPSSSPNTLVSSPILLHHKKPCVVSDSVVIHPTFVESGESRRKGDTNKMGGESSRRLSLSQPILKLTATSEESPYL